MKELIGYIPVVLLLVSYAIGMKWYYKNMQILLNESEIREKELNKFKTKVGIDEYVKQEALSVLKFYNGRKWSGTGKELTETWDEFYEKYQKSKLK